MVAPKVASFKVFKGTETGIQEATHERSVGHDEVLIRVTHSGLCGTDIHYKTANMVLGHEGIGIIEDIGDKVTKFKQGDRVGWGYEHECCMDCRQCLTGREVYCPKRVLFGTGNLDQGSLASHAVWKESFVFSIPEALSSEDAAPLMCGGATVFQALHDYGIKMTDRVGIIGIGGLGHLAIQYAAKMGCEVVVFSSTDSKRDEAMRLGAREFYATKDVKELQVERPIDHLFVTTAMQPDWEQYFNILSPEGTIFPLTVSPGEDLKVPYMPFLQNGIRIQGSIICNRQTFREMLRFSAAHNIKPIIQKFPLTLDGVNAAFEALEQGKMRYRGVLVAE